MIVRYWSCVWDFVYTRLLRYFANIVAAFVEYNEFPLSTVTILSTPDSKLYPFKNVSKGSINIAVMSNTTTIPEFTSEDVSYDTTAGPSN